MNLKKLKEIEDLKVEHREISDKAKGKFLPQKQAFVITAISDFKKYFEENGFKITENGFALSATYGEQRINITFEDVTRAYLAPIAQHKLEYNGTKKITIIATCSIDYPLNPSYTQAGNLSEEQKLDNEIARSKKSIDYYTEIFNDPNVPEVTYQYYDVQTAEQNPTLKRNLKSYTTFYDVLKSIFG